MFFIHDFIGVFYLEVGWFKLTEYLSEVTRSVLQNISNIKAYVSGLNKIIANRLLVVINFVKCLINLFNNSEKITMVKAKFEEINKIKCNKFKNKPGVLYSEENNQTPFQSNFASSQHRSENFYIYYARRKSNMPILQSNVNSNVMPEMITSWDSIPKFSPAFFGAVHVTINPY